MESLRRRSLALALPMLFLAVVAGAETADEWTSRGPFCSRPFGLDGNGGLAYLAVGGNLFRSLDGWATWSRVGTELPTSHRSTVAAAPQDLRLVYFALENVGIFRSRDGGKSWRRVFRGLPDQLVDNLVVPAGPAGTVFAIAPYSGIYRSRNEGETWTDLSPHGGPSNYLELVAHPLHPERLAARTLQGIWRSNDGGDTWKPWNAGLPFNTDGSNGFRGLTLVPGNPDIAFVFSYHTLYKSEEGSSWTKLGMAPVNSFAYVNTLVAGPGATPVLLAGQNGDTATTPGVLRSRDGGKTWKPLPLPGETVYRLSYLPAVGRIVALTARGAFQTSDFGTTWKRTGDGIAASRVQSLAAAGSGERLLVAGLADCPGGIARSSDGGKTWKIREIRKPGVNYSGGPSTDVESLASAPSKPLRVYATGPNEVLRSDDGGITWTHFGFRDGFSAELEMIAVHPRNPDLVFVAGSSRGLSRSLDGGLTWSGVLHEPSYSSMTAVAFAPGEPRRMLAASESGGLLRSVDTGASWEPIPGTEHMIVRSLVIDPRDPDVALASDGPAIYRSVDGGSTWVFSDIGIERSIHGLAFSADGTEAVAAGDEGVFLSRDGGQTWQSLDGSPSAAGAVLLQRNGILHVGTEAGVVSGQGALATP